MSKALHSGVRLLRCLRPPSHTLAFLRPLSRQGGIGLPQFQGIRRIEIPVAACYRPGASGITPEGGHSLPARHHPFWVRCISHFHLFTVTVNQTQVSRVSIGIRSGRSTPLWLGVAELLSLGFPPSRVPLVNAGQVDLTPLFMCNLLKRQSICPVKERDALKRWGFTEASIQLPSPTWREMRGPARYANPAPRAMSACKRVWAAPESTYTPIGYQVSSSLSPTVISGASRPCTDVQRMLPGQPDTAARRSTRGRDVTAAAYAHLLHFASLHGLNLAKLQNSAK